MIAIGRALPGMGGVAALTASPQRVSLPAFIPEHPQSTHLIRHAAAEQHAARPHLLCKTDCEQSVPDEPRACRSVLIRSRTNFNIKINVLYIKWIFA
jgi:hypothetical protein